MTSANRAGGVRAYGIMTLAIAMGLAVGSCGSDGGSTPTPPPTPANQSPRFASSTASASVVENTGGTLFTLQASDPDGDTLSYSLTGADAAAFSISASGRVAFRSTPNFDLPGDANGDNVYEFSVVASDGRASASASASVTVTNDREGIRVRRVATGLTDPAALARGEGATGLLVGFKNGTYVRVDGMTGSLGASDDFATLSGGNYELVDILERPGGGTYNGVFGLVRLEGSNALVLRRGSSNILGTPATSDPVTGALGFGPGGDIFVALGAPSGSSAQDDDSNFGKLIRLTNNPDPYAGASCCRYFLTEMIGSGIRAPGGLALVDGRVAFTDRGVEAADEISAYSDSGPFNFGWPYFEGAQRVRDGGPSALVAPLLSLPLGSGNRESSGLVGPIWYDGTAIAGLRSHVVFLDADGTIFSYDAALNVNDTVIGASQIEVRNADFVPDAGTIDSPVAVAKDAQGTLYILDGDGELFRVEAAT